MIILLFIMFNELDYISYISEYKIINTVMTRHAEM